MFCPQGGCLVISKVLFMSAGFLLLALGIVGIVLPVLPTTPFLLAASFCFLKSSKRLHTWITTHKYFGPRIKRITESGLTRREKISIYALVFAMLTPVFILSKSLHLRIFLVVLMLVKAVFFLRIKTAPPRVPGTTVPPGAEVFPPDVHEAAGE
jgi:uncharacterized membrane protein YbaN (DUF454 family)